MTASFQQEAVVREHFRNISTQWGSRYRRPAKMSDLDMLLRRENVHRLLLPVISRHEGTLRVLDLGCGTGDVLEGLPRDILKVTGVDFVPEMAATAASTHPTDRFAAADATRLPFGGTTFDVITCLGVLEYIPDPQRVLEECARVLRPGGWLIVSFPNRSSWFRTLSNLQTSAERAAANMLNRLRGRPVSDAKPRYRHAQWSLTEAQRLLESAGFRPEATRFNTYGLWGQIGRRLNMSLCVAMSRRFAEPSAISRNLAFTMVIRAVRRED